MILINEKRFYSEKNIKNYYVSRGKLIKKSDFEKIISHSTGDSSRQNQKVKNMIDGENCSDNDYGDDANQNDLNYSKIGLVNKPQHENRRIKVNKKFDLNTYYDYQSFPDARDRLNWRIFTTDFIGKDTVTN